GLGGSVTVTGRIDYAEAPRHLALATVAVSPKRSATEANGKLLNYMAAGPPTVAYDSPVAREIPGQAGALAPGGGVAAAARGPAPTSRPSAVGAGPRSETGPSPSSAGPPSPAASSMSTGTPARSVGFGARAAAGWSLACLALGLAYTWPLALHLRDGLPFAAVPPVGRETPVLVQGDYLQFYYYLWLVRDRVAAGASFVRDPYQFAVDGPRSNLP